MSSDKAHPRANQHLIEPQGPFASPICRTCKKASLAGGPLMCLLNP